MSAVLLMTDSWQPTVLRLVPFSSNNARVQDRKYMANTQARVRNFPVLAVTRSSANSDTRSEAVMSSRSEIADDASVFSEANVSEVTTNTVHTARTSATSRRKKYAKKKVPDTHSEMKEAIKFSVQDLNDQISSSSSLQSSDNKEDPKDKQNKSDYTRTKLPKPSLCPSPDTRFCSPVNGVRRSVPLTPGELELQRIRDSYYVEQVQKRKKYKLNINQLPRSTTPINDHDPDKLNMKQVIAFLQTKTSHDIQKKILSEKKGHLSASKGKDTALYRTSETATPPARVYSRENIKGISRSNTEITFEGNTSPDNTRLATGRVSVMSTKSSPVISYGNKPQQKPEKTASTQSVRSFKERSKEQKQLKQKPMKEFKLFRFLAIAPEGQSEGLVTAFGETMPMHSPKVTGNETTRNELPRKSSHKRNNRESGTAHVLHRHAVNRSHFTPPKAEPKELPADSNTAIKLPKMVDVEIEDPENDSDTGSTTSATCNSTKYSAQTIDRNKLPKKGKSITFDENINVSVTLKTPQSTHSEYNESTGTYKSHSLPRVSMYGPRQIHVNLPQEDKKTYSQEIVRLTLRQDKNATRVTSYMSDIQQGHPSKWQEQNCNDDTDEGFSSMTSSNYTNTFENREWFENSKQVINAIGNNNFIKVRQKLKATSMLNSE